MSKTKKIGNLGEDIATKYLEGKGYTVLERNFCIYGGEIDIIAQKDEITIFVEVRLRKSSLFGHPVETFRGKKLQSFTHACYEYVNLHNLDEENCRIDMIGITPNPRRQTYTVTHIRGVEIPDTH